MSCLLLRKHCLAEPLRCLGVGGFAELYQQLRVCVTSKMLLHIEIALIR